MLQFILIILAVTFLIWAVSWLRAGRQERTAEAELNLQIKKHPQYKHIRKLHQNFVRYYDKINAHAASRRERARLRLEADDFVYGEIVFMSFYLLLERASPRREEIFYDLGSGSGKAVIAAALAFDFAQCIGIERLPVLHKLALQVTGKSHLQQVHFIQGDFLKYDFKDGNIIFINATCLHYYTWEALVKKLLLLKPGARVIVITKKIKSPEFQLIHQETILMSWGMSTASIYIKND